MVAEERTRSLFEDLALVGLAFAPLLCIGGMHLTCSGQDNTVPFLAGMAWGWWSQRDRWMSAAGCCLVTALVYAPLATSVMLWSGFRTLIVTVVVLDAETGQPIPGADVCLHRFDEGEGATQGRTGMDGRVTLTQEFKTAGRSSAVQNTGGISLSNPLVVQATGYEKLREPVGKGVGYSWPLYGPPLPVVEMRLRKAD